jgi:hypothetical protein
MDARKIYGPALESLPVLISTCLGYHSCRWVEHFGRDEKVNGCCVQFLLPMHSHQSSWAARLAPMPASWAYTDRAKEELGPHVWKWHDASRNLVVADLSCYSASCDPGRGEYILHGLSRFDFSGSLLIPTNTLRPLSGLRMCQIQSIKWNQSTGTHVLINLPCYFNPLTKDPTAHFLSAMEASTFLR